MGLLIHLAIEFLHPSTEITFHQIASIFDSINSNDADEKVIKNQVHLLAVFLISVDWNFYWKPSSDLFYDEINPLNVSTAFSSFLQTIFHWRRLVSTSKYVLIF